MQIRTNFRYDINGLRAWAVIAVMLYHFNIPFFNGGFVGVDIFFVISGFLMTKIIMTGIDNRSFSIITFYLARAKRIIPALVILCLITLLVCYLFLTHSEYTKLADSALSAVTFTSNLLFKSQFNYFDDIADNQWLLHTWSLSVEWQFYLFLPVFLVVASKLLGRKTVISLMVSLALVSLALCLQRVYKTTPALSSAFYSFHYRAWEMLAGGLVWVFFTKNNVAVKHTKILELTGFALIVLSVLFIDKHTLWPGVFTLAPVLAACMIITANRQKSFLTNNPVFQWFGNNSYSIYLYHWLIVMLITYLGFTDNLYIVIGILLSIGLGELSYRFIEIPAKRYFLNKTFTFDLVNYAIVVALFSVSYYGISNKYISTNLAEVYIDYEHGGEIKKIPVDKIKAAIDDWSFNSDFPILKINNAPVRGDIKKQNTVFFGDSNIEQYSARIKGLINNERGAIFLTAGGCASVAVLDSDLGNARCKNAINTLLDVINNESVDRVVIGISYYGYFIAHENNHSINGISINDQAGFNLFFNGFGELIKTLQARNIDVYIVKNIPFGNDVDPRNIYSFVKGKINSTVAPPLKSDLLKKLNLINDKLDLLYNEYNIMLIDPLDYLCDDVYCLPFNGEMMSYKDSLHLASSYVKENVSYLDETMQ